MLTVHGVSHPGNIRKSNEDSWLSDLELGLFLVADGMGGHSAGEVASKLAVEAIHAFILRTREGENVTWPYGIDPKLSFDANRLATAIKLANRRVFKAGENQDAYTGMGTTVVAALITGDRLVFASVGDSRIYSFVNGQLSQITKDDSWATTMQEQNPGGPAIPADHPMRHVLTNVIGPREQLDVKVSERPMVPGEVLLFCSDGLREDVTDDRVRDIMAGGADLAVAADALLAEALKGRAGDNVTIVLVKP
jgi:serine/threonine protein phosphatase PrpC